MAELAALLASGIPAKSLRWQIELMSDHAGYRRIGNALNSLGRFEPKHGEYVYQPKLCRWWWVAKHQATCGCVSDEALARVLAAESAGSDEQGME